MITTSSPQGLIAATSSQATAALDELIACCAWPALLHATPQRLRRELSLGVPKVSLFWLDDERDVRTTVQLLAWLSMYQPEVRRIALCYQLPADVEVAIRSAGAHLYLAADNNIRALVNGSFPQWLRKGEHCATKWIDPSRSLDPQGGSLASLSANLHPSGPP